MRKKKTVSPTSARTNEDVMRITANQDASLSLSESRGPFSKEDTSRGHWRPCAEQLRGYHIGRTQIKEYGKDEMDARRRRSGAAGA